MMRTTVSTQPQIIIVACCITLRRSAYGAWGNYSVHDDKGAKNTSASFIGHINPLRYRGYYYDRETRLYYLQSRYYDFANCRFINADTFATTDANGFLSANMFAYCENNPIMRTDETGELWNIVIGALIGVGKQFMMDVACNMIAGRALDEQFSSVGTYVAAAFSGALDAIPGGRVATTIITTALDVVGTPIISQVVDSKLSSSNSGGMDWKKAGNDMAFGAVQRIVGMGIGAKAPKTISDIKPRARRKGIKGTRNLTAHLRRKQNTFSMASNGFMEISGFWWSHRKDLRNGRY